MNRIAALLKIKFPIIQAGMVWCSGWRLASAVSNAGGLGLIGAGSMTPEILKEHIKKCKEATGGKPFGVNIPLLYSHAESCINTVLEDRVPIVFTSGGSPAKWTSKLKENGITVFHVVSSSKFARKAEDSGVDGVVAEGFEAGGHNGIEESTTMTLIPAVRRAVAVPLIAAGGIATGHGMLAALALGAEGVQIGTRFVASEESSAHQLFKEKIVQLNEGDTILALKKITPVRLIKNAFYKIVEEAENRGAPREELSQILGRGRAKKGMFEGELDDGELEIGQISTLVNSIRPASEIISEILEEFASAQRDLCKVSFNG